jgi:hypothetical protein
VGEGAVEDGLVDGPEIPFGGIGAELHVGDGPQSRRLLQLFGVDLVVRRQGSRRPRVGRADVDEHHMLGVGAKRVAHHREPRLRVSDDRALARLDPLQQKRDRAREELVLRFVDECVVSKSFAPMAHRLPM